MDERLLIVRGDLNSASGYSQAIELYVGRLAPCFDLVLGVDLHPNPARFQPRWPYPLLDDREVQAAVREADGGVLVLSLTTPDRFRRVDGARNVGLFFWETTALNRPEWIGSMASMDEIWLPARFMVSMLEREGMTVPCRHVPCPVADLERSPTPDDVSHELLVHEFRIAGRGGTMCSLHALRERFRFVALTTNAVVGRKGYPILADEWSLVAAARSDVALLVKANSVDVTETTTALMQRIGDIFRRVWPTHSTVAANVFVTIGNLTPTEMNALLQASDLFVSASYGEGLGLGVFEALASGRPAICGRHTSFEELLPLDYRYWIEGDVVNAGLYDPVGLIPPSATWGVPTEGAVAGALMRCCDDLTTGTAAPEVARAMQAARSNAEVDFASIATTLPVTGQWRN